MKKLLIFSFFPSVILHCPAQEVVHLKNGSTMTVQNGVEVVLQGGITADDGSSVLNNGIIRLKNNSIANISDWNDNSATGALGGSGLVIFNSNNNHNFSGPTNFYSVQINTGGLNLNSNFSLISILNLIKGKINTGSSCVFLNNNAESSLLNDASNAGYANSWINGNFRRLITNNANTYDFPVGNAARCNLLQFLNNNITRTNYLTASFGSKPGTDAGLNVLENSAAYTAVNNGGVWYLSPNVEPSGGNYTLQLYFNGFTGLVNNQFGILRRADASTNAADWSIPTGSSLEVTDGLGRKVSDGFARRINISDFSQLGIGVMGNVPCPNCTVACSYTQGAYANAKGKVCYNGEASISSAQLMLNAFGATTSQIFGNVANRQFFTLYKMDISNGNIFKMLPGSGNSQPLGVDNISPYDGAFYSDQNTWYLVPIPKTGAQKGKINNQLLSQLMSLWFNIQTSSTLGTIDLSEDTLVTTPQTSCGSGILAGSPAKFGLPHNVILYLNGGNGYANSVNGLFQLANDVLGGANTAVSALDAQFAIAAINNAFDGCRMLTGTMDYFPPPTTMRVQKPVPEIETQELLVKAFPNPYNRQFSLSITSPVSGKANIQFFSVSGAKIYETQKFVAANTVTIVPYTGPIGAGALLYSVNVENYRSSGFVIHSNLY